MNDIRRLRAAVGHRKLLLVYASAVVCDERGRVLMQRRADFGSAWWGLPGGLLEPGETIGACVRREVLEETGLVVEPVRLSGVYSSPRYDVRYPNGDEVQQVTACFVCRALGGTLRADGDEDEIEACRFFASEDLPPRPIWYADMLQHALAKRLDAYFDPVESGADGSQPDYLRWLRTFVGSAPLVSPGAAALVRDDADRVLLIKRRDFGVWGLPAGAMDLGESLAAAVVRETSEETGLEVEPLRLRAAFSGRRTVYPNGDQLDVFGAWFDCRVVGGTLRPDGAEAVEVGYFSLDALPPTVPGLGEHLRTALGPREGAYFE